MDRKTISLATFFEEGDPIIEPNHAAANVRARAGDDGLIVPEAIVCSFFERFTSKLAEATGAAPYERWAMLAGRYRELSVTPDGIGLFTLPMGAPAAVMQIEELIALGARRIILVGAAGGLARTVQIGDAVIPERAIREEGTSYHYATPDVEAVADSALTERLVAACAAQGLAPHRGTHWTTDAPYRELRSKVIRHQDDGVLAVDMEISAIYVVAALRGVPCTAVLAISDVLHREDWESGFQAASYRDTMRRAGLAAIAAAGSA